jgi:REP element-mobilizing transposase RayT
MADTYTQIYIQVVFAVQNREANIPKKNLEELYKYINGIVSNKRQKLLAINGTTNHIHILIGLKPNIAISELVRDIKSNSSNFINHKKWLRGKFKWQEGFGAFSYGHSQLNRIIKYIEKQEEHHKKKTFKEEYFDFLNKFNVEYKKEYVFDFNI